MDAARPRRRGRLAAAGGLPVPAQSLADALRAGGHVIYFRHAATDWSQQDRISGPADWDSCDPQRARQLSDEGRATARQVGEALRRLRIPVHAVVSSAFCRCVETARLLDLGPVSVSPDLINTSMAGHVGGMDALTATVRRRLATPPPAGANTVLVAHGNLFVLAAGARPVEAGAAIVRPDGRGGFHLVRMVGPEEWAGLESIPAAAPSE